jgi:hypothetical protein
MKKNVIILAFVFCAAVIAVGRSRVDLGNATYYYDGYCYDDGEHCDYWFGPGWYWGIYFDNAPAYFAWHQRHASGPCYWRFQHRYQR